MRTTTRVHTPDERLQMRQQGDRLARVCQIRLVCVASVVRTAVAEVIPLCGSAGWWVLPVCLAPGLAAYALVCLVLRRTRTSTILEAARTLLGQAGAWIIALLLAWLLLTDGATSMTALVTSFTEGIGTEGTQVTMAALTLLMLLFCLHRDGLAWGIWLMRWVLMILALIICSVMLSMARQDGLHPVLGQGRSAVLSALGTGCSMGWPFVLLLTVQPAKPGRIRPLISPVLLCCIAGVLACLTFPCETLIQESTLAVRLLTPAMHLPPALRTLAHSLGMLTLFLAIATSAQLAAGQILAPTGRELVWLPGVLAAVLALTQCLPIASLWRWLTTLNQWSPGLLAVGAILLALRRKPCARESS